MPDPTMNPINVQFHDRDRNGQMDSATIVTSARGGRTVTFTGALETEISPRDAQRLSTTWMQNARNPVAADGMTRAEVAYELNGGDLYEMGVDGLQWGERSQIAFGLESAAQDHFNMEIGIDSNTIQVRVTP